MVDGTAARTIVMTLAIVFPAAGLLAPSGALPVPQDDAGTGRDAPDGPVSDVWIRPGVIFWGNTTFGFDNADWFAFLGAAADKAHVRVAGNVLWCPSIHDCKGAEIDSECALELSSSTLRATLPGNDTYFITIDEDDGTSYRFSFGLNGEALNPSPTALLQGPPVVTGPGCDGAPAAEEEKTFGAGDPTVPTLAWAALKTGFRAVVAWQTEVPAIGKLRAFGPGGTEEVVQEPLPTVAHVIVLDGLIGGNVLCFQVEYDDSGGVTRSGIHALRLRNAMAAFDEASGTYPLNLLIMANENVYDRPTIEAGLDVFVRKLWDATDGHVRAGSIIVAYGDLVHHRTGPWTCMLPSYVYQTSWPGCDSAADVFFSHEQYPGAAGVTFKDGIQDPYGSIYMNAVFETPPAGSTLYDLPHELGSVLLHELGHYAFGALDLYAGTGCYDPDRRVSVMSARREATEFDDEVARCPDETAIGGNYTPSWTLLRERFTAVPDRPSGPIFGPNGDGGFKAPHVYASTRGIGGLALPHDDAGSGRDAPRGAASNITIESGRVYWGNITQPLDEDWYGFQGVAGDAVHFALASNGVVCPGLYDDRGRLITSECSSGDRGTISISAILPRDGRFFASIVYLQTTIYRFSLGLNEPARDPALAGPPLGNDAASGRDAGEGPTSDVMIEPGRPYWGNTTPLIDGEDWYAFSGTAGALAEVALVGDTLSCPSIHEGNGTSLDSDCILRWNGRFFIREVRAILPADGTFFVRIDYIDGPSYWFSLGLDSDAPDPGPLGT